jgi:hypothetical protein
LNPYSGVTVIVVVAFCPALIVVEAGLKETVNVAASTACVSTLEVEPAKFESPPYTAVMECDPVLNDDVLYVV